MARIMTKSPIQISERNIETYPFTGAWARVMGEPDVRFSTLIRGGAKSGKSSFCSLFAQEVSQWGRVLYISTEERLNSKTLQERLKRLDVTSTKIRFSDTRNIDDIDALLQTGGYRFVIIDSIQKVNMGFADFVRLRTKYKRRKLSWHLVTQLGRNVTAFRHEVDALVEVKDGMASVSGRFKQSDVFKIFDKNVNQNQLKLFK